MDVHELMQWEAFFIATDDGNGKRKTTLTGVEAAKAVLSIGDTNT